MLNTLNVGWLDSGQPFPTGPVPDGFLAGLLALAERPVQQMRGWHPCPFCGLGMEEHPQVRRGGVRVYLVYLGSAEIGVRGADGITYAAPTLVYHYVEAHGYRPPEPFIEAVMRTICVPAEREWWMRCPGPGPGQGGPAVVARADRW